jgi:hypothetical protein
VQGLIGDISGALGTFERLLSEDGRGWSVAGIERSPLVEPIRQDPRFVELMERLRAEGR